MDRIKVLLAEDHTIVRKGIRSLLDGEPHIEIVGEAEDGYEAVEKTEEFGPDVVLMDITMPNLNGLEATRQIKKQFPEIKILVLTMYTNEEYILQLLQAGASGYLVKHSVPGELLSAIEAVARGETFLSPSVSGVVIEECLRHNRDSGQDGGYDLLTSREREILQLISEGHSSQAIADRLCISPKTVRVHRANLMEKLGVDNTAELVKYAIRKGVTSLY